LSLFKIIKLNTNLLQNYLMPILGDAMTKSGRRSDGAAYPPLEEMPEGPEEDKGIYDLTIYD
jgi:hypothetical protein